MKPKINRLVVLLISMFFLASCEHLGPQPMKKMPLDETYQGIELNHETRKESKPGQGNNATNGEDKEKLNKAEFYKGSGNIVNSAPNRGGNKEYSSTGKFTLNFEDAELTEVVKVILNDTLNESYIIDPKIKGKVTLQTSRPLTREELLPTLELLLQVNDAALMKRNGVYQVELMANALKGGASVGLAGKGSNLPAGYQVQIIPLKYVGVEEMQEILKPIVPPKALLSSDSTRNLLMVVGTGRELMDIREAVRLFDVDYMQGMSFAIFHLNNVDTETMINELNQVFSQSDDDSSSMLKMVAIERLNAILVISPQPQYLDKVKYWVARLDRANISASGGVVVYRAQHTKAVELAATLNEIFTGTQGRTSKPSLAPGLKASEATNKNKEGKKTFRPPSATKGSGDNDIRIIADESNNSLIISATAQDYEKIRNVVKQLDVMPLQVLIDATIMAVRLTDEIDYGVKWKFNNTLGNGYTGEGLFNNLAAAGLAAQTGGFSYLIARNGDIKAEVHALAKKGLINVLSAPSLMVLNNHEAYIKVGDQVPIRTTESTNTNASLNPIQTSSIEYRDTGVILTLTPRVNAGGIVIMDIEQKVDNVQPPGSGGSDIDSPTILQRQIRSSVAVEDSETLVLGGLIDEQFTENKTGIPWLMDLPYMGVLFSSTKREKIKQELVVLITPHVVEDKVDGRQVTLEYKRKLPTLYEDLSNIQTEQIKMELKN